MRLGQRWPANSPAPSNIPPELEASISLIEEKLCYKNQDTTQWYWTLTYLENRPVVQLDDGTTLRMNADGTVSIQNED